jgi:nitroreductase
MSEMGLYEAMGTLRAVRKLRSDPIPDDVLAKVFQAATFAPTGGNRQPWRMIAVRDPELKAGLADLYKTKWSEFAASYAKAFEGLADDERAKEERTLAAGDYLADHLAEAPVLVVVCFNPKFMAVTDAGLDRVSVVGGGSIYPAVENLLLAARAEGLGCVLTTLLCIEEDKVKALLDIPDGWGTAAMIPLGYPVGKGHGPINRLPVANLFFADKWGTPEGV